MNNFFWMKGDRWGARLFWDDTTDSDPCCSVDIQNSQGKALWILDLMVQDDRLCQPLPESFAMPWFPTSIVDHILLF